LGFEFALLQAFATVLVRLTPKEVSQHFEGSFVQKSTWFAQSQRRTLVRINSLKKDSATQRVPWLVAWLI